MKIKLFILILVLSLSAVTSRAQADRPARLEWGDHSRGLRMAVWTNSTDIDYISAVIRNFGAQKIAYREGAIANYALYARQNAASKWREIKMKPLSSPVIAILNCPIIEPKKEERFGVDLREHDFPSDWSGLIEVRIVRFLSLTKRDCEKTNLILKLKSRTVNVKLPLTGAVEQR